MESNTSTSDKNYPKSKVITAYLCFGGAIGGGVIGLVLSMLLILATVLEGHSLQKIIFTLVLALLAILSFAFWGLIIGFIPATLTGCLVARLKLYRNDKGLLQSAIIGVISTVICALLFTVFSNTTFSFSFFIFVVFAAFLGGVSAYVVGLFVLPKPSLDISNSTSAHQ